MKYLGLLAITVSLALWMFPLLVDLRVLPLEVLEGPTLALVFLMAWALGNVALVFGVIFFEVANDSYRASKLDRDVASIQYSGVNAIRYRRFLPSRGWDRPFLFPLAAYQIAFLLSSGITSIMLRSELRVAVFPAGLLVILIWRLLRLFRHVAAIGNEVIEIVKPTEIIEAQLQGRFVITRTFDTTPSPFSIRLQCWEKRNWIILEAKREVENFRELYWTTFGQFETSENNPFQEQTIFPFKIDIPPWLPRPWKQSTNHGEVGIEWELLVEGAIGKLRFGTTFDLGTFAMSQPKSNENKVRIERAEIAELLGQQNIHWELDAKGKTKQIYHQPPLYEKWIAMAITAVTLFVFTLDLHFQWIDWFTKFIVILFEVWLTICYWLFGDRGSTILFTSTELQSRSLPPKQTLFGMVARSDIAEVRIKRLNSLASDENGVALLDIRFQVSVESRVPDVGSIEIATIKRRFLAKAFAYSIANELGVDVKMAEPDEGLAR